MVKTPFLASRLSFLAAVSGSSGSIRNDCCGRFVACAILVCAVETRNNSMWDRNNGIVTNFFIVTFLVIAVIFVAAVFATTRNWDTHIMRHFPVMRPRLAWASVVEVAEGFHRMCG
jgi:hypothetical protein